MTDQQHVIDKIRAVCAESDLESSSLVDYVLQGAEPGHFLAAVLENDLGKAAERADGFNRRMLYEWAMVMYAAVPSRAHGSRAKVDAWIKLGGLYGSNAKEAARCATSK